MNLCTQIDKQEILKRYKPIDSLAHKGIQGHALIIGGSYGKIGAVVLSAKAALKTGCGLVSAFIPECGYNIVQTAVPEVMVITGKDKKNIINIKFDLIPNAIGIGPGMEQKLEIQKAFHDFLLTNSCPLVIDADALNILSQNKDWLKLLPKKTIFTPHKKELERLIGSWETELDKMDKTIQFSEKYDLIVVVKGAPTVVVDGTLLYQNTTGNAALATAGSGDVLTGMITSLLAQSYKPIDAALIGVYLHGLTADIAIPETGYQSFIASDIILNIGKAYLSFDRHFKSE
jgi:hydroxyethylthiazole kinase-like uncharacterized protein yjeF